jgi:hypothetical protein
MWKDSWMVTVRVVLMIENLPRDIVYLSVGIVLAGEVRNKVW